MFIPPDGSPLPMVAITDGQFIKRVGNQFEGADPGGGADTKAGIETAITEGSTRAVTFTTAFAVAPNVVVGFADNSFALSVCAAHTVSTTGFTIAVNQIIAAVLADRDVSWIATDAGDP